MTNDKEPNMLTATVLLTLLTAGDVVSAQGVSQNPFLSGLMSGLSDMPSIRNVLRAAVHPLYRPIINPLRPSLDSREGEDTQAEYMKELCFGDIGCLTTDEDFFHPIYRPVNLPPYQREEIRALLTVHSREHEAGEQFEALDVDAVTNTTFSATRDTKIIIHGFLDGSFVTWMLDMVRALLAEGDYNVVTVDWAGGSQALYLQATANTRVVGLEVAHFILWLRDNLGLDPARVHIIGHSLGAHTAGYAGERVPGLGRITGLDPAEPYFQYMPPAVRLDPSDAAFVDVIHTDTGSIFTLGYGLEQPIGHLDFYPNGGREQPGCDSIMQVPFIALTDGRDIFEGLNAAQKELVACNHNRAPKLFTDSILSPCPYLAFQCTSYQAYLDGECHSCGRDGTWCARMGLHADRWPGRNTTHVPLYLTTNLGPHYCLYHYLVTVRLGAPGGARGSVRGLVSISLITQDGQLKNFALTKEPKVYERGQSYTFFLEHTEDLSDSSDALVHWRFEADLFDPLRYCMIFCDTSLPLQSLSVRAFHATSHEARENDGEGDVVMCHRRGEPVIRIASKEAVKVVASPVCRNLTSPATTRDNTTAPANTTSELSELDNGILRLSQLFF